MYTRTFAHNSTVRRAAVVTFRTRPSPVPHLARAMKFCVCIKQVPDVSAPIQIRDGELVMDAGRAVLNAYDASAVEEALVLTAAHGGEVDVLLIGPERAAETVRKALAMGAARGTHLVVADDAELDSAAVSAILARHLDGARATT